MAFVAVGGLGLCWEVATFEVVGTGLGTWGSGAAGTGMAGVCTAVTGVAFLGAADLEEEGSMKNLPV